MCVFVVIVSLLVMCAMELCLFVVVLCQLVAILCILILQSTGASLK